MPKLYEYFGLTVMFYANEHEPIHVHGKSQGRESRAEIIVLNGKVANDQFTGSVRVTANKIYSLTELRAQSARHVQVSMNGQAKDPDAAKRLFELLKPYRNGPCPIVIAYERSDGRALLELPDEWRVQPSDEMLGGLRTWLSREGVRVVYA